MCYNWYYEEISTQDIKTLAEDDISRYDGVSRNQTIAKKVLSSIARNNHTLVKKKTLINDVAISEPTFDDYFDVLEKLFVLESVPAWSPNIRSKIRLRSAAKTRFIDPSLAIAALGLTPERLLGDLETLGFIFENLCSRDILTYADSIGARVFHYREAMTSGEKETEMDLVVELPDGEWGGFEIKLGANQIDDAEKNLLKISKKLQENGVKPPKCLVVVSGLSNFAYTTENGVKVVPIGCLKS